MGLKVGWGGASGNQQGGVNSVSQVDGNSNMTQIWCLLAGSVGREVIKGRMGSSKEQQPVPALLSERERAAFPQLIP